LQIYFIRFVVYFFANTELTNIENANNNDKSTGIDHHVKTQQIFAMRRCNAELQVFCGSHVWAAPSRCPMEYMTPPYALLWNIPQPPGSIQWSQSQPSGSIQRSQSQLPGSVQRSPSQPLRSIQFQRSLSYTV